MKFDSDSAVLIRECQGAKLYYAERDEFEKAAELIKRGEEAAEKAIPEIRDAMSVFLPIGRQ